MGKIKAIIPNFIGRLKQPNIYKYYWFEMILFAVSFILRLIVVRSVGNMPEDISDGARFYQHAINFVAGIPAEVIGPRPVQDLFVAFHVWLFKNVALYATRVTQALIGAFIPVLIFRISKKVFNDSISIISGIVATLYLGYVLFSRHITAESNMVVLVLTGTLILYNIDFERFTFFKQAMLGLFISFLACMRIEGLPMGALIVLYIFLMAKKERLKKAFVVALFSMFFMAMILQLFEFRKQDIMVINYFDYGMKYKPDMPEPMVFSTNAGRRVFNILNSYEPVTELRKKLLYLKFVFSIERPRLHEIDLSNNEGMDSIADKWRIGKLKLPVFYGGEMLFIPFPFYFLAAIGFFLSIKSWKSLLLIYAPVIVSVLLQLIFHPKGTQLRLVYMHSIIILSAAGLFYLILFAAHVLRYIRKIISSTSSEYQIKLTLKKRETYYACFVILLFGAYYFITRADFNVNNLIITKTTNPEGRQFVRVRGQVNKPLSSIGLVRNKKLEFVNARNTIEDNWSFNGTRNLANKYTFEYISEYKDLTNNDNNVDVFLKDRSNNIKSFSCIYQAIKPMLFWDFTGMANDHDKNNYHKFWDFNQENNSQDWLAEGMARLASVNNGVMHCRSFEPGGTPMMSLDQANIDARVLNKLIVKMKNNKGARLVFHWWTDEQPARYSSASIPVIPDNEFHIYQLYLDKKPDWNRKIRGIRIDPIGNESGDFYIDYIGFVDIEPDLSGGWEVNGGNLGTGTLNYCATEINMAKLERDIPESIDTKKTKIMVVKMKHERGAELVFHWWTNEKAPGYAFMKLPIISDNKYHIYFFDLNESPQWNGTVRSIRIDPIGLETGKVFIDYIGFVNIY